MDNKILTELPRHMSGANKGSIDWNNTKNMDLTLLYKYNEYQVKVLNIENGILTIEYDGMINTISISNFYSGNIGNILGLKTSRFYYKIDDIVNTKSGKIRILNTIYIKRKNNIDKDKAYKVECLLCKHPNGDNYTYEVRETDLKRNIGCPCCSNTSVVKGINDVHTTHKHILEYFVNIEDSYKYSYGNANKIELKCPICGTVKLISLNTLTKSGLGCVCSDGFSYPSKFTFNILKQLDLKFITEYAPKWAKSKRYDFNVSSSLLIEVNGLQHYEENNRKNARTLEEEIENDIIKKQLALNNGFDEEHYISIDCRESDLEWIKNSILKSNLAKIYDLSIINWDKANEFALSNLVKVACDYWNNGIKTTKEIAKIMDIDKNTVCRYLKQGVEASWCDYNPKEESIKNKCKKIICKENGRIFKSIVECSKQSLDVFGVNMIPTGICAVCNGKYKTYKGYSFEYYL